MNASLATKCFRIGGSVVLLLSVLALVFGFQNFGIFIGISFALFYPCLVVLSGILLVGIVAAFLSKPRDPKLVFLAVATIIFLGVSADFLPP